MLMLPPISLGKGQARLPVSGDSSLGLLAALSQVKDKRRDVVEAILPRDPALLVWALECESTGNVTWTALVDRFSDSCADVLKCIGGAQPAEFCISVPRKIIKRVNKYRAALDQLLKAPESRVADEIVSVHRQLAKFISRAGKVDQHVAASWLNHRMQPEQWVQLVAAQQKRLDAGKGPVDSLDLLCCRLTRLEELETTFETKLLTEKLASLKQLAYGASHEINNPLANITTRAESLLVDEHDAERARKLAAISQQAFRAHEMIANMMLFAHPPSPDLQTIDPLPTLQTTVDQLQPAARAQNTLLTAQLDAVPAIQADRTQLSVAVAALIQNALESVQQNGQVTISVSPCDGSIAIEVAEDGPGIATEHVRHIFDPFFSGREAGRGLGFGLSKAWRIAEIHCGDLVAENQPYGGALFRMRLPYAKAG